MELHLSTTEIRNLHINATVKSKSTPYIRYLIRGAYASNITQWVEDQIDHFKKVSAAIAFSVAKGGKARHLFSDFEACLVPCKDIYGPIGSDR